MRRRRGPGCRRTGRRGRPRLSRHARKRPVIETYHGVTVTDDYRWLEDDSAPDVQAWVAAQNQVARAYLDAHRAAAGDRQARGAAADANAPCGATTSNSGSNCSRCKSAPPTNQPHARRAAAPTATSRRSAWSLDPARRSIRRAARRSTSTGRRTTASMSSSRCRRTAARTALRTSTTWPRASRLPDVMPGVNYPDRAAAASNGRRTAAASTTHAIRTRASGPPADLHFYQTVWFHALGTPVSADRYVIGRDFPRIAEIALNGSRDGQLSARRGAATATAAKSRFTCATAPDNGRRSPISRTASSRWRSATTTGCTR